MGIIHMKQVWQSTDGKKYGTQQEIEEYENQLLGNAEKAWVKLKQTYWFRNQCKYPLSTYGVWHVRGEDPNCDMGGAHHQPSLGYFEGTLEQVLRHAVMLPGFWQWGGGGDATLVDTVKL